MLQVLTVAWWSAAFSLAKVQMRALRFIYFLMFPVLVCFPCWKSHWSAALFTIQNLLMLGLHTIKGWCNCVIILMDNCAGTDNSPVHSLWWQLGIQHNIQSTSLTYQTLKGGVCISPRSPSLSGRVLGFCFSCSWMETNIYGSQLQKKRKIKKKKKQLSVLFMSRLMITGKLDFLIVWYKLCCLGKTKTTLKRMNKPDHLVYVPAQLTLIFPLSQTTCHW